MGKKKVALVMGTQKRHRKVDIDGDGRSVDEWVKKNAALAGKSEQEWLNGLSDNINASSWAKQEGRVPQMNDADDLRGVIDGVYGAHSGAKHGGSDQLFSMMKAGGARFDPSWQYKTSLKKDTGQTEQRKVYDFSKKSWVVKDVPVIEYLSPNRAYLVGNFPVGSIVQVTNDTTGQNACMIVGDTGTSKAEMSAGGANAANIPINGREIPTTNTTATLTYLGQASNPLDPEAVRSDCERLQAEYQQRQEEAKKKAEEAKKKKAKGKQAQNQTQGGAHYLAQVVDHGVHAGTDQLLVAVADPSCLHDGEQPVCTGSNRIVVGVAQSPLAGEGDLTKDGFVIRKGTGDQTIEMT